MLPIETGVPIPPKHRKAGRAAVYPFGDLRPGDSFFVPLTNGRTSTKHQTNICVCAHHWRKRYHPDWQFTTRVEDGGVRVWRVK